MDMVTQIVSFSLIMWFVLDRVKPLWDGRSWSKYVTMALSIALGELLAFCFQLDFVYAVQAYPSVTVVGEIFTGVILSAGASAIYELIDSLKSLGIKNNENTENKK